MALTNSNSNRLFPSCSDGNKRIQEIHARDHLRDIHVKVCFQANSRSTFARSHSKNRGETKMAIAPAANRKPIEETFGMITSMGSGFFRFSSCERRIRATTASTIKPAMISCPCSKRLLRRNSLRHGHASHVPETYSLVRLSSIESVQHPLK